MRYKNIPDLYLINGKIVFRKHLSKNGKKISIWKTLGKPEDFKEEDLKKLVQEMRRSIYSKLKDQENFPPEEKRVKILVRKKDVSEMKEGITGEPTFGEILDRFFSWYRVVRKESTCKNELYRAKILLKFFGREIPFTEINMGKVEEFKVLRLKQGVSKSTINKDLRLLATVINRSVDFGWIHEHPLYRKPFLIKGQKAERIRYLSKEEEKRLIQVLESGKNRILRNIVVLALNTGLRLGEILNLKWENVDFTHRLIVLFPEQTKNGRRHFIPMNSIVYEIMREQKQLEVPGCPYVFHRRGRKVRSIKKGFKNALKKAGIEDFRFHDLRHTFASRLVQMGVDLYVVKELLNHSSITVTQRYAHLRLENVKRAVEMLEK